MTGPEIPHQLIRNLTAWAEEHYLVAVSVTLRRSGDGDWDFIAIHGDEMEREVIDKLEVRDAD